MARQLEILFKRKRRSEAMRHTVALDGIGTCSSVDVDSALPPFHCKKKQKTTWRCSIKLLFSMHQLLPSFFFPSNFLYTRTGLLIHIPPYPLGRCTERDRKRNMNVIGAALLF